MARIPCTHFNPALGVKYLLTDIVTGEEVMCRVLSPKDKSHYPIRSPRNSVRGEEFFKVMLSDSDNNVLKVMNSIKFDKAITEDSRFEFTGKRPNGHYIERKVGPNSIIMNEQEVTSIVNKTKEEDDNVNEITNVNLSLLEA